MRRKKRMRLHHLRRTGAPVALLMSVVYLWASLRSSPAAAEEAPAEEATGGGATYDRASRGALSKELHAPSGSGTAAGAGAGADAGSPSGSGGNAPAPGAIATVQSALDSSPGGGGVSPQAAALPGGAATQLGLGESFSAQLSTGSASYGIPIALPTARGHAQPNLSLSYSSSAGAGLAGVGWSIGAPAIVRQTDRGLPRYDDRATWHPNQDRFALAGMELVPICTVASGTCAGAQPGEVMPSWSSGWQYFRARSEGTFIRMFWSPDHRTWRGQSKDGTNLELGVPLDGSGYEGALERNPDAPTQIFGWHLVRQYDAQTGAGGQPVNTVQYRYTTDRNTVYLTDIVDTSPAASPTTTDLSSYAHHAVLTYAARPDVAVSYRAGYRATLGWRVSGIDVTSKPFTGGTAQSRELVRRYHLNYDPTAHRSLLTSVVSEGRCATSVKEDGTQRLPNTSCPTLPPIQLEYQRATGATTVAALDSAGLAFEGLDTVVRSLPQSPQRSIDDPDTGLIDVNGDGLPDVLVTAPGLYGGMHGLYINAAGGAGQVGFGVQSTMPVTPTGDVPEAGVLALHSPMVSALDLDADGFVDLVHMTGVNRYSIFSAKPNGSGGFQWTGREVSTSSNQNVKINFAQDARNVRVLDVDGDGLVDVVYNSATDLQTFFSLGRLPGGDGQFGTGSWASASTATLSNDPAVFCPPWSGEPVRLSSPDIQLADMNGDGLTDIVRVRDGEVLYWPGRGNGFWGTGSASGCAGGGLFAVDRSISMNTAPHFGSYDPGSLLMSDVDGDGLADMVVVRSQNLEVFLNDNGTGWTSVVRVENTPFRPANRTHVRLTDIDGSGTPDLLWGLGGDYRYIDFSGGRVRDLLSKVTSGVGETLSIEYTTSANQMIAAAAAGKPWATFAPSSVPLLSRTTVSDHGELIGRPATVNVQEYTYRDPVYEGRQREFRGFSDVVVKTIGDANTPTSYSHTVFQLGECSLQFVGSTSDVCTSGLRWQDNWREPLKGLPVLSESYDDNGVYLSTQHTTYELRQLYMGLDGRAVSTVVPLRHDTFVYDTGAFDAVKSTLTLDEVVVTVPGKAHTETRQVVQRATVGTARLQSTSVVDNFGNATAATQYGCISGCPNGVDEAITAHSEFNLPAGDTSGWSWRQTRNYVTGSVSTASRHEQVHTFDPRGNLLSTYGVLSGGMALDRHHAIPGSPTAPAPTDQSGGVSGSVQILMAGPVYDGFGNATFNRSANNRCTNRDYDPDYQQLAVVERVAGGALDTTTMCGANLFAHTVTYDRGMAMVIDSHDPRNQPARYAYDGFGRLTSVTEADPAVPGQLASLPSTKITYQLPSNPTATPYTITDVQTQDGTTPNVSSYTEQQIVRDSMGRTIVELQQADSTAGDTGDWVASGYVTYDAKGNVARSYDATFYTGTVAAALAGPPAGTPYTSQQFTAFGLPSSSYGFDHVVNAMTIYHAMSTDAYDEADILATVHQGTYSTKVSDGHGRQVQTIRRIKNGSTLEQHLMLSSYLPTGEVASITQRRSGSSDVVRTMQYDSFGRMVLNTEPNSAPNTTSGWRYAYNDSGALVGTSDARGCGANFFYDLGGRLLAEDRSPCLSSQPTYSAPNLSTGDGTEAFYRYDAADPDGSGVVDAAGTALPVDANQLWGRVASVASLGAKVIYAYDALGRQTGVGARVAKPAWPLLTALSARYAPRWYVKLATFDAADRPLSATSGATVPQLLGTDGTSTARFSYTKRGHLRQAYGSYGTLYAGGVALADGRPKSLTLGDAAATHRDLTYDVNLRPQTVQTFRAAAPLWSSPPPGSTYTQPLPTDDPTRQLMLENRTLSYDEVGNLTRDEDDRVASDWPAAAKPVTRTFDYDDIYRLTHVTYTYPGGPDSWKSPFAAENANATLAQPSPQVSFTQRMNDQRYQYDWLGNLSQTTDDQQAFWDRSTGDRTLGFPTSGPNQVRSASNRNLAPTSPARGDLSVGYDLGGNVTDLVVRRDGSCLPAGASCWQRFIYEWDEVGQLAHALRWDLTVAERTSNGDIFSARPPRAANAELRFAYNNRAERVLKTATDPVGNQVHSLYLFGSLEMRRTTFSTTTGEYTADATTTSVLLPAGAATARIIYSAQSLPSVFGGQQHVLLELPDQVGSTTFSIDRDTGELVEAATFQGYGAAESDYRPGRWGNQREPYKFSGKEEDIELGLSYFGARYYSPYLGVFLSPDPVTIHGLGSDINPYAYVYGSPQMLTDPDGRIAPLVIFIIVVVVAALAAGTTAAIISYEKHGRVDWGKVGIAAGIGAASAAASFGVASAVSPAIGGVSGTLIGGAAGGVAGGTVSYGLSNYKHFKWDGLGKSMLIGGVSGVVGAGAGMTATAAGLSAGVGAGVAGGAGAAAGWGAGAAFDPQHATWQSLMLDMGIGIAASVGSYQATHLAGDRIGQREIDRALQDRPQPNFHGPRQQETPESCVSATGHNALATEAHRDVPEAIIRRELGDPYGARGHSGRELLPVLRDNGLPNAREIAINHGLRSLVSASQRDGTLLVGFEWSSGGTHRVILQGVTPDGNGGHNFTVLDPARGQPPGQPVAPHTMTQSQFIHVWDPELPVIRLH
jgi:RHS repeat-associated protein